MRYEHINRVCHCGNTAKYIWKGNISATMVRRREDTMCERCLNRLISSQCTGLWEWEPLTDEKYNERNSEND